MGQTLQIGDFSLPIQAFEAPDSITFQPEQDKIGNAGYFRKSGFVRANSQR
jgi:hypothetical protein